MPSPPPGLTRAHRVLLAVAALATVSPSMPLGAPAQASVPVERSVTAPPVEAAPAASTAAVTATPAAGHQATYACGDLEVKVRFDNTADTAVLAIGDRVLTLPLAVSGSGARYADAEGNELWTKGMEDGRLTLAGEPPRTCVAAK